MTNEQKIRALAELDGWKLEPHGKSMIKQFPDRLREAGIGSPQLSYYLTSYDAIIPLIQKQSQDVINRLFDVIELEANIYFVQATPTQLADALLIATGRIV